MGVFPVGSTDHNHSFADDGDNSRAGEGALDRVGLCGVLVGQWRDRAPYFTRDYLVEESMIYIGLRLVLELYKSLFSQTLEIPFFIEDGVI